MKSKGSRGEIRTYRGKINWVQIDPSASSGQALGKDDHDHFISPEERLRVAMARQSEKIVTSLPYVARRAKWGNQWTVISY